MQRCQHRFRTPLDLIKHLIVCEEAPRGSVQCEQCDHSHAMTRLRSPTQLFRKLMRKRGQTNPPNSSASSQGGKQPALEDNGLDKFVSISSNFMLPICKELPGSDTQPTELDSLPLFEVNALDELELDGKEVYKTNYHEDFKLISELPATFMDFSKQGRQLKSSSNEFLNPAATESVMRLGTPKSNFVPSPLDSSIVSRQTTSRKWSDSSQASTLLNMSPRECWPYTDSLGSRLQQAPFASLGSRITTENGSWLPHAALTLSPEEMVPTTGTQAPWLSGHQPYVQQGMSQSVYANAVVQTPQHSVEMIHHNEVFRQAPSWPSSASVDRQHWATLSGVPDKLVSSTSAGIYESFHLSNQPFGGVADTSYGLHNPTIAADSSVAVVEPSPIKTWDTGSSSSRLRKLTRNIKATRATSASQKTQFEAVANINDGGALRCTICNYRPTGKSRNLRSHLKRHMKTHMSQRQPCPFHNCKMTFPIDRWDNVTVHCRSMHDKKWSPAGHRSRRPSGTTSSGTLRLRSHENGSSLGEPWVINHDSGTLDAQINDTGVHGQSAALYGNLLNGMSDDKDSEMTNKYMRNSSDNPLMEWSWDDMKKAGGAYYSDLQQRVAAYEHQIYSPA